MTARILTLAGILWRDVIRRKDAYVLAIMLVALLAMLASVDIFGLGGVAAYVLDLGMLMAVLFGWLLAIMVGSRQLPQEEGRGTIFALLAKPVTRFELIAGKWLGAWSVVSAASFLFIVLVVAVSVLRGCSVSLPVLAQACLLQFVAVGFVCAVAMAFSTRLNTDAAATLTGILIGASYLVVPQIPALLARESGWRAGALLTLYNLLPHLELFDLRLRLVHRFGPVPAGPFLLVVLYGSILIDLALLWCWIGYRNKRFSRGALSEY